MKKAAIFDIDGTILKDMSSERVLFRYLLQKKVITAKDVVRFTTVFVNKLFLLKGIYLRKNKHYLTDKDYGEFVSHVDECFRDRISPHISPVALEEMNRLKKDGYLIILLSGTLSPLVECFRKHCNADIGIGTSLGVGTNGAITGEVDGIHAYSGGKVKVVERITAEYDLDLPASSAYANQYLDVKFMRMVGCPVAVNATRLLRFYATRNQWRIVEF